MLGVDPATVRRMAARGDLPCVRAGADGSRRTLRFDPHAVAEALTDDPATRSRIVDAVATARYGATTDTVVDEFLELLGHLPTGDPLLVAEADAEVAVSAPSGRRWFRIRDRIAGRDRVYGLDGDGVWRHDGDLAERLSRAGKNTIISNGSGAGTGVSKLTEDVAQALTSTVPIIKDLSGVDLTALLRGLTGQGADDADEA